MVPVVPPVVPGLRAHWPVRRKPRTMAMWSTRGDYIPTESMVHKEKHKGKDDPGGEHE